MPEFKLVSNTYDHNFNLEINKLVEKGWKPFGNLSTTYNDQQRSVEYSQLMVKEED